MLKLVLALVLWYAAIIIANFGAVPAGHPTTLAMTAILVAWVSGLLLGFGHRA